MPETILKQCNICKIDQTLENFKNMSKNKYGKSPYCIPCEKQKKREYYIKNAEHIKEKAAKWKKNNPDKIKEQRKTNREKNLEKIRLRSKNKEARRRSRKRNSGEFLVLNKELKKIYSSPCFICGSTENITADHIIPIAKGGRHSIGNLQALCKSCNSSKGKKLMSEWKIYLNMYNNDMEVH